MLRRRRLTLAPPAWRPGDAGSRFSCLRGLNAVPSGLDGLDGEHVAVHLALEAMDEDEPPRPESPESRRPPQSEAEIRQKFWEDVGFPTPASRFWEKVSPPPSSSSGELACRFSPVVEPVASSRRCRGGMSSSPSRLRLTRSPPRMGPWRGPLPPRRSSPPPVLGTFIDKAFGARPLTTPAELPSRAGSTASATHVHALDRDRPSWEHLRRWFKCLWDRACPTSTPQLSTLPPLGHLPRRSRSSRLSSSAPSPTPTPPSLRSTPPPAPRWPRSFSVVATSPPLQHMAGAPPRPPPGGGSRGGPSRPPTPGLSGIQPTTAGLGTACISLAAGSTSVVWCSHSCQNHDSTMRFYDFTTQIEQTDCTILLGRI